MLAANKPQFSLGDKLSIFSDKAYRKNNGKYFEAVGNVVIISQRDTIYGELASLDQETQKVKLEGNVRFVTKDMTLYGSHIDYNLGTGIAHIKNARIITSSFNLVSRELVRLNQNEYLAKEAEFTTCKDCIESWSVFGKNIKLTIGKYVQISHGLFKIKGIDVIYLPYIVLPILSKRETGLLIPRISQRTGEGLSFEQPFFWAIDESKDLTISPTFWAKRGYGGDLQFRRRFNDMTWFEFNTRMINDKIYFPNELNVGPSDKEYFRTFADAEGHQFWTSNLGSHLRYTASKDLDFVRDFPMYTDPRTNSSDFGLQGFINWRREYFSLNADFSYLRNQLFADPTGFDNTYVQVLPRVSASIVPVSLIQSRKLFLQNIALGFDGSFTRFRQVKEDESNLLRNADRVSIQPYLSWYFFNSGPFSLKSQYVFDQQVYRFSNSEEPMSGKNAGLLRTELNFSMDRIYGLAFEEKIPIKLLSPAELKKISGSKELGLTPIQKDIKNKRLIGDIPEFQTELVKDNISQKRNSYRHSLNLKLIHHFISSQNEYGNTRFLDQIKTNQNGMFDYEDALRSEEYLFGANSTRTIIPPKNTLEFQWNNTLIRKSPKNFNFLEDDRYLRDNYHYSKIGWFNISQGYLFDQSEMDDLRQRLSRLMLDSGFIGSNWNIGLQEYYFHYENQNIFNINFTRRFEYLNLFTNYSYNSFSSSNLNTIYFGGQIRPTDVIGLSLLKNIDLEADKDIRTIYSVDIMPHNNCWIFNLNYRKSIVDSRFSFNILFNFADENFSRYRNDYFGTKRF